MINRIEKEIEISNPAGIPELEDYIGLIKGADQEAMIEASNRQDYRVKVPGSLGRLEDISIKIAGITGNPYGNQVDNQAIVLMCADNGVVEEGVASAPQTVTLMQTINFTKKITGVGSQAKHFGIDLLPIDIGVKLPIPQEYLTDDMAFKPFGDKIVNRRIADGTRNFTKGYAMTREEAIRAIKVGIEAAEACKAAGKTLIGVGEMGIGNTTTSSAIIAGLSMEKNETAPWNTYSYIEKIVGRGGGLSDKGLELKRKIIAESLIKYGDAIKDPLALLHILGGYDIAGMVGVYLGAAANRIPVVIDGVISMAAALLASKIAPKTKDFMFTSHKSMEGGYSVASEILGIDPMFDLGMRLGEGSGCPIAFKIIEAACAVINNMWSLQEAQVDSEYLEEFRKDGQFESKA